MRALVQILKAFGADDTDLGKLLRVPGTINSKSGVRARLLNYEPDHRQDFDELCLQSLSSENRRWSARRRSQSLRHRLLYGT